MSLTVSAGDLMRSSPTGFHYLLVARASSCSRYASKTERTPLTLRLVRRKKKIKWSPTSPLRSNGTAASGTIRSPGSVAQRGREETRSGRVVTTASGTTYTAFSLVSYASRTVPDRIGTSQAHSTSRHHHSIQKLGGERVLISYYAPPIIHNDI